MIGLIRGLLVERAPGQVLVDVAGVGYEIDIPVSTFNALPQAQQTVQLFTHLAVREDAQQLFGFASVEDRDLFRALIRVNGVGPRLALTILSGMDASALAQCVHGNDVKALTGLPGVGKKTAERLIIDLRDRLPEADVSETTATAARGDHFADAETALIGLGFKPQEAARALACVEDSSADVETLIKLALKELG